MQFFLFLKEQYIFHSSYKKTYFIQLPVLCCELTGLRQTRNLGILFLNASHGWREAHSRHALKMILSVEHGSNQDCLLLYLVQPLNQL